MSNTKSSRSPSPKVDAESASDIGRFELDGYTVQYVDVVTACKGKPYKMSFLRSSDDAKQVIAAVNQGIDSRLEACSFEQRDEKTITGVRLHLAFSPGSLPVLLRRLAETGDEEAEELVSGILGTLGWKEGEWGERDNDD